MTVFHAGTAATRPDGPFVTAGGRVLGVTALGADLDEARRRAYAAVGRIGWPGAQYRPDIAEAAALAERRTPARRRTVIPRYARPRWPRCSPTRPASAMWLEVELLAVEGWAAVGVVPAAEAAAVPGAGPRWSTPPSWRRWPSASGSPTTTWRPSSTWSRTRIGQPEGSWVHYGLTSSDVVDTALCATLVQAADLLLGGRRRAGGGAWWPGPSSWSTSR